MQLDNLKVFNKSDGKIYQVTRIYFIELINSCSAFDVIGVSNFTIDREDAILIWWTGFYDIDNEPICDGSIFVKDGKTYTVVWEETRLEFIIIEDNGFSYPLRHNFKRSKIIGHKLTSNEYKTT